MIEHIKNRWVTAIESGEYKKCNFIQYHRDSDAHCAMGVLVEVILDEGVDLDLDIITSTKSTGEHLVKRVVGVTAGTEDIRKHSGLADEEFDRVVSINDRTEEGNWKPVLAKIKSL